MAQSVRPRVFVTRQLPGEALGRLGERVELRVWEGALPPSREALLDSARGAEGLITLLTDRVDEGLLSALPSVRAVSNVAVGYDNIDVAACTARRIAVGNTPGVLTETSADFAFALLVGILAGAYSSIFIAPQVLSLYKAWRAGSVQRAPRSA